MDQQPAHDDDRPIDEADELRLAPSQSFAIVGVGASAGGLEAFSELVRALPADTGMAFVLVPHLDPAHPSYLREILGRSTQMPVVQTEDEPRVEPDHIYIIPPNRSMVIRDGHLRLLRRLSGRAHRPIDAFLRSLAADQGESSIAVILSGMGSDGALGLSEIKAQGGITFAQNQTAQHDGMPRSAVASGDVDFVLSPARIAEELARIAKQRATVPPKAPGEAEGTIARILRLLHNSTGVDFTHYKSTTLYRRISRRMLLRNLESLGDYLQYLKGNQGEIQSLYRDILINVTSFFRDPEAFAALKTQVFPQLLAHRSRQDPVRVWALGCSTGEEAYSLAMALTEYGAEKGIQIPLQIFATDLNEQAVDKARSGLYSPNIAQDVSHERLRQFFVEADGGYRITKSIRDMCIFAKQNVLTDPPFSRMDLISSRNLLIYMEPILQRKVIPLFHYALRKNGYLWLGTSETVAQFPELFDIVDSKYKVYAKKSGAPPNHFAMPLGPNHWEGGISPMEKQDHRAPTVIGTMDVQKEADRIALAKYSPPGVLVNADHEILQFRGDTSRFLSPAPGKPNLNVLKMAREGLLIGLRSALQEANESDGTIRIEGLQVKTNGGMSEVNLEVLRVGARDAANRSYLVLFEDAHWRQRIETAPQLTAQQISESAAGTADSETNAAHVARMKQELEATRDYLQSLIEQQEAANEELQSANEEIQSSNEELQSINEELQTTKEEIQSSNEELTTVNEELADRNDELNRANNDLMNFLSSAQLVLLTLGPDLRIRWFTPQAEKMLNLISSDVGRPIGDIRLPIDVADLEKLLAEVIDTVAVKELEVQDRQGRWYSLRLRPYRTMDNRIEGAVMALIDIDPLKCANDALAHANRHKDEFLAMLAHELRNPLAPLKSQIELLRSEGDPGEPTARPAYDLMQRQIDQLSRLVGDLLDAARISQGRIELKSGDVDVRGVIRNVADLLRDSARQRKHELQITLPDEPVFVNGDPVRLEQMVSNLVTTPLNTPTRVGKSHCPSNRRVTMPLLNAATRESASPRRCCPSFSTCLFSPTFPTVATVADWGLDLPLSNAWPSCMVARSEQRARDSVRGRPSRFACPL